MEYTGRKPRGLDLMRTLLELLAEQEGVEITYTLEQGSETLSGSTNHEMRTNEERKTEK